MRLFRSAPQDVLPAAKDVLLETLTQGVMVVNQREQVVEINPAALEVVGRSRTEVIGRRVSQALELWPELVALLQRPDRVPVYHELEFRPGGASQPFRLGVQITPLMDGGQLTGRLIVWQDLSPHMRVEAQLADAHAQMRAQSLEIKSLHKALEHQAIRDSLTQLLNRRFLEETLPKAVARANRNRSPISILILDVDELKHVNDIYGYEAGDQVLQNLAKVLLKGTRKEDVAVRLGGDEFLILIPEAGLEVGMKCAEKIREGVEKMDTEVQGRRIGITVSIGVAEYPSSSEEIRDVMRKADQALYRAKYKGRNQVTH